MKKNLKFFLLILMLISTLFLLSMNSWLNMWIWLEINLISFISLMINKTNKMSMESSLIYFLIQTIASILLLFSILMILFFNKMINLLMISILIKLGSAPFHFWIPLMIFGLDWFKIFLLLTWQKINPLIMLYYNYNNNFLNIFILFSLIMSSLTGLNYSSMKKIMTFSSINQLSWIMISLNFNKLIKLYFLFYFYMMWIITICLKTFNINFINEIFNLNSNKNFIYKMFLFMKFMSLGGLPPFLGFFPKMMIIMKMNNTIVLFFMIVFSLIMLFMYLRIIMSIFLMNPMKINLLNLKFNKMKLIMLMKFNMMNNFLIMILFFIY